MSAQRTSSPPRCSRPLVQARKRSSAREICKQTVHAPTDRGGGISGKNPFMETDRKGVRQSSGICPSAAQWGNAVERVLAASAFPTKERNPWRSGERTRAADPPPSARSLRDNNLASMVRPSTAPHLERRKAQDPIWRAGRHGTRRAAPPHSRDAIGAHRSAIRSAAVRTLLAETKRQKAEKLRTPKMRQGSRENPPTSTPSNSAENTVSQRSSATTRQTKRGKRS